MIEVCSLPNQAKRFRALSSALLLGLIAAVLILGYTDRTFWSASICVLTGWLIAFNPHRHHFLTIGASAVTGSMLALLTDEITWNRSVLESTSTANLVPNGIVYGLGSLAGTVVGLFRRITHAAP